MKNWKTKIFSLGFLIVGATQAFGQANHNYHDLIHGGIAPLNSHPFNPGGGTCVGTAVCVTLQSSAGTNPDLHIQLPNGLTSYSPSPAGLPDPERSPPYSGTANRHVYWNAPSNTFTVSGAGGTTTSNIDLLQENHDGADPREIIGITGGVIGGTYNAAVHNYGDAEFHITDPFLSAQNEFYQHNESDGQASLGTSYQLVATTNGSVALLTPLENQAAIIAGGNAYTIGSGSLSSQGQASPDHPFTLVTRGAPHANGVDLGIMDKTLFSPDVYLLQQFNALNMAEYKKNGISRYEPKSYTTLPVDYALRLSEKYKSGLNANLWDQYLDREIPKNDGIIINALEETGRQTFQDFKNAGNIGIGAGKKFTQEIVELANVFSYTGQIMDIPAQTLGKYASQKFIHGNGNANVGDIATSSFMDASGRYNSVNNVINEYTAPSNQMQDFGGTAFTVVELATGALAIKKLAADAVVYVAKKSDNAARSVEVIGTEAGKVSDNIGNILMSEDVVKASDDVSDAVHNIMVSKPEILKNEINLANSAHLSKFDNSNSVGFYKTGELDNIQITSPKNGDAGRVLLGDFDYYGRPTGVVATITPDMLKTGSIVPNSLRPPGFINGDQKHNRGHLLAGMFGGDGKDPRNVVTLFEHANKGAMKTFEITVKKAVEQGETINYFAKPIYTGANPVPIGINIIAKGSDGFEGALSIRNIQPDYLLK